MKSSRSWVSIALILILIAVGWWWLRGRGGDSASDDSEVAHGSTEVFDRVWIDSKPQAYTDYVQAFLVLSDIPVGVFQKASSYKAELEIFEYTHKGGGFAVVFPQDDRKKKFNYKVTSCDDLPPFDLCLTLSKNPWQGPKKYYSMSEPDALLDATLHELRHRVEAVPAQ